MSKKKKVVFTVLTVVAVLGGILGGTAAVMADEDAAPGDSFLEKVVALYQEKTGTALDTTALQESLTEARQEMGTEHLARLGNDGAFLDKLVEDGVITQKEADAFQAWLDARPDIDLGIGEARHQFRLEIREGMIDKLVEDGVITQEEADAFQAWLDARPDIDLGLQAGEGPRMDGGMHRVQGQFGGHGNSTTE